MRAQPCRPNHLSLDTSPPTLQIKIPTHELERHIQIIILSFEMCLESARKKRNSLKYKWLHSLSSLQRAFWCQLSSDVVGREWFGNQLNREGSSILLSWSSGKFLWGSCSPSQPCYWLIFHGHLVSRYFFEPWLLRLLNVEFPPVSNLAPFIFLPFPEAPLVGLLQEMAKSGGKQQSLESATI